MPLACNIFDRPIRKKDIGERLLSVGEWSEVEKLRSAELEKPPCQRRGGDIILEDNRSDQKHPFEVDDAAKQRAALALTPLYFPFLVFFSLGKLFALLLLPLEIIAIFSYASLVMQKEVKKHMEEEKRRLKEQETREELGMWR